MIRQKPDRIASLLASSTEIICQLGLAHKLVAISHECDYPAQVMDRPRVTSVRIDTKQTSREIDTEVKQLTVAGQALYSIDIDLLASLKPDLIITQSHCEVCAVSYEDVMQAVAQRHELAETAIVALNPTSLESVFDDIVRVGNACHESDAAQRLIATLRDRLEQVKNKTHRLCDLEKPRTVCIEWIDPVMVAANWLPDLLELAGGRCSLTQAGVKSPYTDWHDVVEFDPEVIVVMPCGFDLIRATKEAALLTQKPGWSTLSACKNSNVFAVDGNAYFNRSGPRLVDSLELLAGLLHPKLFPEHDSFRREYSTRLVEGGPK